jgi:hypothetical protein
MLMFILFFAFVDHRRFANVTLTRHHFLKMLLLKGVKFEFKVQRVLIVRVSFVERP